jgi:hypothetical protein
MKCRHDTRWLLGAVLALCACQGETTGADGQAQLEAVDVAPALTVPTEADTQAKKARVEALTGVLPQNFPADLALPIPASLIDFGDRFVVLQSPRTRNEVTAELRQSLRQKGWSIQAEGLEWRLSKSGRKAGLRFEKRSEITVLRYDY